MSSCASSPALLRYTKGIYKVKYIWAIYAVPYLLWPQDDTCRKSSVFFEWMDVVHFSQECNKSEISALCVHGSTRTKCLYSEWLSPSVHLSSLNISEAGKDTGRNGVGGGCDTRSLGFGEGGPRLSVASLSFPLGHSLLSLALSCSTLQFCKFLNYFRNYN